MIKRNEKGQFIKGSKFSFWTGKTMSDEHKKKMSISHKGCKPTKETRKKLSLVRKGKKLSKETKQKIKKIVLMSWQNPETRKKMLENRIYFSDNKHWNWKGGITSINCKIRRSKKYYQWRLKVFRKDNFICQKCGIVGKNIEADHIKKFSTIISENNIKTFKEAMLCKELWNIDNGRVLCRKCHLITKNYGTRQTTQI